MQLVDWAFWQEQLLQQHYTRSELKAKRWQIFMMDSSQNAIQLTDNVSYFDIFVDPKFVPDKNALIGVLLPIVYTHLCEVNGVVQVDKEWCVRNVEQFTRQDLIPNEFGEFINSGENLFYITSGDSSQQIQEILSWFTQERIEWLIVQKLDAMIQPWFREVNYVWISDDPEVMSGAGALPYIEIKWQFIYVRPDKVIDKEREARRLYDLLAPLGVDITLARARTLVRSQENRYVKIIEWLNAKWADQLVKKKRLTLELFNEAKKIQRQGNWIDLMNEELAFHGSLELPLMHGVWLEEGQKRYYPHERFAAHLIGYVDQFGKWNFGIEEYYQDLLAGKDGKVIWLATPWIGEVWANNFEIEKSVDGKNIYLSIDPIIQKEIELIANKYVTELNSDSVAITVLDPRTWKIRAMVNAPDFNPNDVWEAYKLLPIGFWQQQLVENPTYMDIPLLYMSGENMLQASFDERKMPGVKKYFFANELWPQAFVNKNISSSYEPWSIMKPIAMGIAIDTDSVGLYDYYNDPWKVQVWEYTISNVSRACIGTHTFLHALEFSCNVWMIRMAQSLSKYVFYNYMDRLWFGKITWIELAWEDGGKLPDVNNVPLTQYYNNTYGQWLLATPLQMAVWFATLINWWILYQPSIVYGISDSNWKIQEVPPKVVTKLFKEKTSSLMRTALESVLSNWWSKKLWKPWYTLGAKTWTAQIAFRGRYQNGAWWTNGSVMWIVSTQNPTYVIAIQVKRPRISPWAEETAWKIFTRVADFLVSYERVEK